MRKKFVRESERHEKKWRKEEEEKVKEKKFQGDRRRESERDMVECGSCRKPIMLTRITCHPCFVNENFVTLNWNERWMY